MDRFGWGGYRVLILTGCLLLLNLPSPCAAAGPVKSAESLHRQLAAFLGARDAAVVAAPDGHILAAIHQNQLLVPASTLKVLTALAALHYLGKDHHFATDFFLNADKDLIIKGYGDPLLISERLEGMAAHLADQIKQIHNLVLDDSYFSYPIVIPGRHRSVEPYDAPNGALCVNFNTVFFKKESGRWVSAEPQTPLLPSIIPKIEASGLKAGRITLAADHKESLRYAGELFSYFFRKAGISTQGAISFGQADSEEDQLLWRYLSDQTLTDVIADLLAFSNNFIANQLLLVMGARAYGAPATVDKGLQALRVYYTTVLGIKTGFLVEASGISRRNRVSAAIMMDIVDKFSPYYDLMRREGRQWYKTGTLKGIHTRVGYLGAAGGGLYRFVVMINTPGKRTDRIMEILERELK